MRLKRKVYEGGKLRSEEIYDHPDDRLIPRLLEEADLFSVTTDNNMGTRQIFTRAEPMSAQEKLEILLNAARKEQPLPGPVGVPVIYWGKGNGLYDAFQSVLEAE